MPTYLCNTETGEVISKKADRVDGVKLPLGKVLEHHIRIYAKRDIPVQELRYFRCSGGKLRKRSRSQINRIITSDKEFEVRQKRMPLLQGSDWREVSSPPEKRVMWMKYRQDLRDITNQPGFPENVSWPEAPE